MQYSQYTIDTISALPIMNVAAELGIRIINKKALCYNEHDKDPSLNFSFPKNVYHCHGCGEGGGVIKLVMNVRKLSFLTACNWLIERFNVDTTSGKSKDLQNKILIKSGNIPAERENQPNPDIYEWIIEHTRLSDKAFDYLHGLRKISKEVINMMGIRSIDEPKTLYSNLQKAFTEEELILCGITTTFKNGNRGFIWWKPVILFPCRDLNLRVNYIQGRPYDQSKVKHLNPAGVKRQLYNLDILHQMNLGDELLFCEGITDTLSALSMGYRAIGVLGANNFDRKDTRLFMDYNIAVVPDSDKGGEKFTYNIKAAFAEQGKSIDTFQIPGEYNDLNELYIKEHSRFQ